MVALFVALLGALAWLLLRPRDPLFHGKPESVWIKSVSYGIGMSETENREQVRLWRDFGAEGLEVLSRGLDKGSLGRTYRKLYRRVSPRVPGFLTRLLPFPGTDPTRSPRMCVLDLLTRMGKDASLATPAVARTLKDEDSSVRQIAISFFTSPEDEHAVLNTMPKQEKRKLLPEFIRAVEDKGGNWGLRNNAALALGYYPEQAGVVSPVLVKGLQDPFPYVRLIAAQALNRVDPDAAKKAGAVSVAIQILKLPDDQVASRAARFLGEFQTEPELAVSGLIEALESTNTLVACSAIWSLEWAFPKQAETIVPALKKAAQRKDNAGSYAKAALKHVESAGNR